MGVAGGFSMGGAAAVFASLRHPAVFGVSFLLWGSLLCLSQGGDPYVSCRQHYCAMPTEDEHDRVWVPPAATFAECTTLISSSVRRSDGE